MHVQETSIPIESRSSLGTRISWGAVLAGVVIALSMQFLLTILGTAAGLSLSDRASGRAMQNGAMIYLALTIFASLFVGGMVTTLLTGGENKQEAVISGLVMWGIALMAVLFLGVSGVQGGANMLVSANNARTASWEESARQAGVSDTQINEWRAKNGQVAAQAQDPANQQAAKDAATRAAWYGFFITWISMVCAAVGAYAGTGPMFRIVTFSTEGHSKGRRDEHAPFGKTVPAAT